jgi:hypothetical protein
VRACRCRFPHTGFLIPNSDLVWELIQPVCYFALGLNEPFELTVKPNHPLLRAGWQGPLKNSEPVSIRA